MKKFFFFLGKIDIFPTQLFVFKNHTYVFDWNLSNIVSELGEWWHSISLYSWVDHVLKFSFRMTVFPSMKFIENLSNFHIYGIFFLLILFDVHIWFVPIYSDIACVFLLWCFYNTFCRHIHTFPPVKFKREVFQLYIERMAQKLLFVYY